MFRILIVEDEGSLLNMFCRYLNSLGYTTFKAINAADGLKTLSNSYIDLLITDLMMPDMNGCELVKTVRMQDPHIPIIMVTTKSSITDKKLAFASGIDDYMVKPIDIEELGLRVEALLRRSRIAFEKLIKIGNTIIDYNSLSVYNDELEVKLSKKEFEILFKLMSHPNIIFSRRQLMDELWEYDKDSAERTIDVHIRRIRNKLADFKEINIDTMHSLGYKGIVNSDLTK